jgi:hypothetical protein
MRADSEPPCLTVVKLSGAAVNRSAALFDRAHPARPLWGRALRERAVCELAGVCGVR